jgi:hypothetical protein
MPLTLGRLYRLGALLNPNPHAEGGGVPVDVATAYRAREQCRGSLLGPTLPTQAQPTTIIQMKMYTGTITKKTVAIHNINEEKVRLLPQSDR